MAVVTIKGTIVTNRDASPQVKSPAHLVRGKLFECCALVETNADDSIGSIYRLGWIKSSDRVSQILLSCDAITSGAGDIGLYRTTEDGGAVVDADLFASAQSIASALKNSDVTYEAQDINKSQMRVWEALGATSDPNLIYDVAMTLTAATTAAGTVVLKTRVAAAS